MNNFTLEELQKILNLINAVCNQSMISSMHYGEIVEKLESMIANYSTHCEHSGVKLDE